MDDWDLQAVVRGFTSTTSSSSSWSSFSSLAANTTTTNTIATNSTGSFAADICPTSCFYPFGSEQVGNFFSLSEPFEARNVIGELHELYKPFFPKSQPLYSPQGTPMSSLSSLSFSNEQTQLKQQQQPKKSHAASVTSSANSHTSRSKRRKNQLKRICQVPAEALSSDVWAWRKYGQKPIKGSPYPRGYYRCSSSKGCMARKQVERNRSDPGMFIVTYTAEHNHPAPTHRNSLAGSTRQKTVTASDSNNNKTSSTAAKSNTCSSSPETSLDEELLAQSTNTESKEEKDIMEDDDVDELGGFSETAISDDFFSGLEELATPATGDYLSDHFPSSFGLPWLANNAATAASGI